MRALRASARRFLDSAAFFLGSISLTWPSSSAALLARSSSSGSAAWMLLPMPRVVGHVGVYLVVARFGDVDRALARQLDAVGAQVVVDRPELLVVEVVVIEGALDNRTIDLFAGFFDELIGLLDEVLGQDPLVGLRLRLGFGSFGLRDTGFFRRLLSQGLPFSSL